MAFITCSMNSDFVDVLNTLLGRNSQPRDSFRTDDLQIISSNIADSIFGE